MAHCSQHFIQWVICIAYLNKGVLSEIQDTSNATTPEDYNCTFTDDATGYTLDLTYFRENDILIKGDDNLDTLYYYKYTPCQNGISTDGCANDGAYVPSPSMLFRYEYNNNIWCYDSAAWDNGIVQPIYNSANQSWYFFYENGMTCNSEVGKSKIYWICDNSTEYEMTGS